MDVFFKIMVEVFYDYNCERFKKESINVGEKMFLNMSKINFDIRIFEISNN